MSKFRQPCANGYAATRMFLRGVNEKQTERLNKCESVSGDYVGKLVYKCEDYNFDKLKLLIDKGYISVFITAFNGWLLASILEIALQKIKLGESYCPSKSSVGSNYISNWNRHQIVSKTDKWLKYLLRKQVVLNVAVPQSALKDWYTIKKTLENFRLDAISEHALALCMVDYGYSFPIQQKARTLNLESVKTFFDFL
ncbi:hypothetical protein TNCV_1562431 [Trichonephila clavipes]|nr:hypothetical protein TNCV_1562431 [Trichonephila clavipes]